MLAWAEGEARVLGLVAALAQARRSAPIPSAASRQIAAMAVSTPPGRARGRWSRPGPAARRCRRRSAPAARAWAPSNRVGRQLLAEQRAGDVGDDRDPRRAEARARRPARNSVQHRVHQRGVEGVARPRSRLVFRPRHAPVCLELLERLRRRRRRPTARGPLTAATADRSSRPGQRAATSSSVASTASHRAARGQRAHQPAAGGDQRARVRQGQHPGHVRGGDLADRVADQAVRRAAPATRPAGTARPRPRTAPAGCNAVSVQQRRLAASLGSANSSSRSGRSSMRVERRADLVERLREDRVGARAAPGPCPAAARPGR